MIELNDDTRQIFGRPNFVCRGIAHRLRELGLYDCKDKAEDEQAITIHFLASMYEQHGNAWREEVEKVLG